MGDALEARPFKVFENEADLLVGLVELHRSLACIPLGLELGQHLADFAAIHAIAALVRASIGRVLDHRVRHCFLDDVGQFVDAVVVLVAAHVECFVVDQVDGSMHRRDKRP